MNKNAEIKTEERTIKVHRIGLFLDTASAVATERIWKRIMKSKELTVALNPEIETIKFISDENPSDFIKHYKPVINQALTALKGSPDYDYVWDHFYNLHTGADADTKMLLVFMDEAGAVEGSMKAWEVDCTISVTELNGVAETLTFDILFKGSVRKGTVVSTDGVPVFTETK